MIINMSEILMEKESLKEENKKLKRLLKLAVEDLEKIEKNLDAKMCEIFECDCIKGCLGCPYLEVYDNEGFYTECKWKHIDEAMKFIGGNENE